MPINERCHAAWRKSSRSNGGGAQCVEVAEGSDWAAVRDSKLGKVSPILAFDQTAWSTFVTSMKSGQFDR